jgi:hypothetical protein
MEQTALDNRPEPNSIPFGDLGVSDDEITNLPAVEFARMIRAKYGTSRNNASNLERIRGSNLSANIPRWGWRIYRTTYASDSDWDRFMQTFHKTLAETFIKAHGNDKHMKYMQWRVVSDRARFDGATIEELRKHFLEWRDNGGPVASEPQMTPGDQDMLIAVTRPKYEHFIQVDQHSLKDVLSQENPGYGRVNVVTADWPRDGEKEGWELEDLGFVRESLSTMYPALWDEISMERKYWYQVPEPWTT